MDFLFIKCGYFYPCENPVFEPCFPPCFSQLIYRRKIYFSVLFELFPSIHTPEEEEEDFFFKNGSIFFLKKVISFFPFFCIIEYIKETEVVE